MKYFCKVCGKTTQDKRFKKYCSEVCRIRGMTNKLVMDKIQEDWKNGFDLEALETWKKEHQPRVDSNGETWISL
jgi:hypothetical protein